MTSHGLPLRIVLKVDNSTRHRSIPFLSQPPVCNFLVEKLSFDFSKEMPSKESDQGGASVYDLEAI